MALATVNPDGNGAVNRWYPSGSPAWEQVNEGVDTPNTNDWVCAYTAGMDLDYEIYTMQDVSGVDSTNSVKVRIHGKWDIDKGKIGVEISKDGSSWETQQVVTLTNSWATHEKTFTVSWNQTEINGLQIRLQAQLDEKTTDVYCATADAVVDYNEAVVFKPKIIGPF